MNPVDYSVWRLLQEVYKIRIIDLDELKQLLRSEWPKLDNVINCGSHSSVASSIAPDQWYVFCTHSLAIFPTRCNPLDSNLANLEANSEVSLPDSAVAWWAFQVSQGSVEALLRRGGKCLHNFAANYLWKLYTKFCLHHPRFVGDITKNILDSFFPDTV